MTNSSLQPPMDSSAAEIIVGDIAPDMQPPVTASGVLEAGELVEPNQEPPTVGTSDKGTVAISGGRSGEELTAPEFSPAETSIFERVTQGMVPPEEITPSA